MEYIVTIYWKLDPNDSSEESGDKTYSSVHPAIAEAAALLRDGQTVAFPTETVYGLGADATGSEAVARIFAAKGRPSDNPLIVHIAETSQLNGLVEKSSLTPMVRTLMEIFWPGPLTIVLPAQAGSISPLVTAGLATVGVRIPDHPVALELLKASGLPIAAPSANSSGRPSPTLAEHVLSDLDGLIGGLLDGGQTGVGLESTVIECSQGDVYILRPGGVTAEQLRQALPGIKVYQPEPQQEKFGTAETPKAPGMKYAHYAPQGRMQLVEGVSQEQVAAWIQKDIEAAKARGESTGILTFDEHQSRYRADLVISCGKLAEPETIAHGLYAALRQFDEAGIGYILAEACPEDGIGLAVMNRLRKAAGYQLIRI
jgi:L-threonylcarbamoyladenylate synthase